MKRFFSLLLLITLVISMLLMTACNPDDVQDIINNNTKTPLATPTNIRVDEDNAILLWNSVEYASGYTVLVNETTYTTSTNSFSLQSLKSGEYTLSVKANGDGTLYVSSAYSDTIGYTRNTSSGNEYEDDVVAAFREFDEINTKNSFLGYGIDIINANAITSKNVLMTYPIFDMDKLMDENLLKSNEHYNTFESIEAATIEEFTRNMGNSTSITSGANVSAKGNIKGVDVSASASLSSGLSTSFTKTSNLVESQYFLEIIAENQSYWLILQTSEQRYKELLSEEFKSDLYNTSITPAQLFEKYGTHMLTSVAMGGNICMYYTMYSYDKSDLTSKYAEVSSTLKTNVEAAYGGASVGAGTENSFNSTFTYQTLAHNYGIHIDKKIISAGGGSFGINNETTLYENYYDWQKSLDTYPVVIGIKDANSLYPIWNLLDLNVEGAAERYNELYNYFQEYGTASYNNLCETYSITPSVTPTGITNITVGTQTNYSENQVINVKAGDTLQISFEVEPYNANKYQKTFAVDDSSLATIDSTGLLTIAPSATGGSYIKVTVTAGAISKQITLYVINTYNVSFNTRVNGLEVASLYGVLEGYTIDEPQLSREGYILEGWYSDAANTNKFDFENDCIISNMTLYAKWVAIKPVVTFDTGDGSIVDSQTLAYNGTAIKPKNPTLTGYTFDGWYIDDEYTELYDFSTTVVSDITLYARWTRIEFTVTFVANGGTPVACVTTSVVDGYKITEPTTVRQYYTLEGWYQDEALTSRFYFESEITADIMLYAKWTPTRATVQFVDTDGLSSVYDELGLVITARNTDIEKEFKITAPTPVKEGYTFVGWYLNGIKVDLAGYSEFKPQEESYKLVAGWSVNSYTVTFMIDGEEYAIDSYKFGEEIFYPEVIVEGYTFSGWKYGYKALPSTMPSQNITVTGTMSVNNYAVRYYVDGELYSTKNYAYGTAITLIDEPTVEGKNFSGWVCSTVDTLPATMPAYDLRIDGSFNQTTYYIRYYIDGVLVKTSSIIKGHGIPAYIPESREGYTFSGWLIRDGAEALPIPEVMPAYDIAAYGSYTVNEYTIAFNTNGGSTIEPIVQNYGTAIAAPEDPTKTGYTFVGWDMAIPSVMPAENLTITAIWTVNQYTIVFDTDGGSAVEPIVQNYGTAIIEPNSPVKTGYMFDGWYADDEYTEMFDFSVTIVSDITLYAKWTLYVSEIVYEINSETTVDNQETVGEFVVCGEVSSVSHYVTQLKTAYATTYSDYYDFLGWFTAPSEGLQLTDSNGTLLANVENYTNADGKWIRENFDSITLYAHWKQRYDGTYIHNGYSIDQIGQTGTYYIIENITWSKEWTPISTFSGMINGLNHTISNLSCVKTTVMTAENYGFIVTLNGTVQNLNFDSVTITADYGGYSCDKDVAIGCVAAINNGTISNVRVVGSTLKIDSVGSLRDDNSKVVSGSVGGICGKNNGTIVNCHVQNTTVYSAALASRKGDATAYAGGITGYAKSGSVITNCTVSSCPQIKAYCEGEHTSNIFSGYYSAELGAYAGGIAGEANGAILADSKVSGTTIEAEVTGAASDCQDSGWGTICGNNNNSSITNCS